MSDALWLGTPLWLGAGWIMFLRFLRREPAVIAETPYETFFAVLPIALAGGPIWLAMRLAANAYWKHIDRMNAQSNEDVK